MATPKTLRLFIFSFLVCFVLIAMAALTTRFVIEPEIRRFHAFKTLNEKNVIGPPLVTLFGGRAPGTYDPVPAPAWFKIRQRIARTLAIQTEPWRENCSLYFRPHDASLVELANSCEDLRLYINRTVPKPSDN